MQMLGCRLEGRGAWQVAGEAWERWVLLELRDAASCVDAKTFKDDLRAVEAMDLGKRTFSVRPWGQEAHQTQGLPEVQPGLGKIILQTHDEIAP